MTWQAIMNTPGYMPWADEPAEFDTASDAWAYLAEERREQEDAADDAGLVSGHCAECSPYEYSETVQTLDAYASAGHGEDTVYGDSPGSESEHDLGIAYSVVLSESESE